MKHSPPPGRLRSRKRFGQNFLTDQNFISRIVAAVSPRPDDHVIEIGPGHGALTQRLIDSGCQLQVIEIDRDLVAALHGKFPSLAITEADVLKHDFSSMAAVARSAGQRLRIVGNLPYNISTPLLFKLFAMLDDIEDMHFMLQLEVVNRMVAPESTRDYGRLSVMTRYYCEANRLFSVPATAFTPSPKVTSAVVRLTPRKGGRTAEDTPLMSRIVTEAFSRRRKTLRNALGAFLSRDELLALSLEPGARPENLTMDDYVRCANLVSRRTTQDGEGDT